MFALPLLAMLSRHLSFVPFPESGGWSSGKGKAVRSGREGAEWGVVFS